MSNELRVLDEVEDLTERLEKAETRALRAELKASLLLNAARFIRESTRGRLLLCSETLDEAIAAAERPDEP